MDENASVYRMPPRLDVIFRVWENEPASRNYEIQELADTDSFVQSVFTTKFENSVLKNALRNVWLTYRYHQEYNSYLLGGYTKEEFREIAESYAVSPESCEDPEYISFATNLIFKTLNQSMSSSDISIILNLDIECVENSIKQIGFDETAEKGTGAK